ncbi:hypothetical protein BH11PSE13_BH11PSE13_35680 [soil metagenome]
MTAVDVSGDGIVTILVPTFNRRRQLQKAVESVLQEVRVPIRLKIFDNASSDDTSVYASELAARDSRVSYVRHGENLGAIANFIGALSSVETAFFVPLADDDWLLPDFLFDAFRSLKAHPDACAAVFVTEGRDEAGALVCTFPSNPEQVDLGFVSPEVHLRNLMTHGHYGWSSVLWRSATLEVLGAPYFHVGLPSDVDMQLQVFSRLPAVVVNKPGAVYLMHANQNSHDFGLTHVSSWARMFERLDRTALGLEVLSPEAYLPLRQQMAGRYRAAWTAQPKRPMSFRDSIRAAIAAGVRLGDWETAFNLLRIAAEKPGGCAPGVEVITLPNSDTGFGTAELRQSASGLHGAAALLLAWVRDSLRGRTSLVARTEQIRAESERQQQDIQALHTRCSALEQERDGARSEAAVLSGLLAAEQAQGEVLRHELSEARLLGSLRFVPRKLVAKLTGRPLTLPRSQ